MKRGNLVTGWLAAVCLCGCGKEPAAQTPGDPDAPVTILNIIHAILDSSCDFGFFQIRMRTLALSWNAPLALPVVVA